MSENYQLRKDCVNDLELDIIGLAETHLIGNSNINVEGYSWFGQNRRSLHFRARKGSGGVGFLIKNTLFKTFDIRICDDLYEGILWLELINKDTKENIKACVCYLVPEFSTRFNNPQ